MNTPAKIDALRALRHSDHDNRRCPPSLERRRASTLSGFHIFVRERNVMANVSGPDVLPALVPEAANAWGNLSAEVKEQYSARASEERSARNDEREKQLEKDNAALRSLREREFLTFEMPPSFNGFELYVREKGSALLALENKRGWRQQLEIAKQDWSELELEARRKWDSRAGEELEQWRELSRAACLPDKTDAEVRSEKRERIDPFGGEWMLGDVFGRHPATGINTSEALERAQMRARELEEALDGNRGAMAAELLVTLGQANHLDTCRMPMVIKCAEVAATALGGTHADKLRAAAGGKGMRVVHAEVAAVCEEVRGEALEGLRRSAEVERARWAADGFPGLGGCPAALVAPVRLLRGLASDLRVVTEGGEMSDALHDKVRTLGCVPTSNGSAEVAVQQRKKAHRQCSKNNPHRTTFINQLAVWGSSQGLCGPPTVDEFLAAEEECKKRGQAATEQRKVAKDDNTAYANEAKKRRSAGANELHAQAVAALFEVGIAKSQAREANNERNAALRKQKAKDARDSTRKR